MIDTMERKNDTAAVIRKAYDSIRGLEPIATNKVNHLVNGLFIDSCLDSAQAQHMNSFIYHYDGSSDDSIISISDVFCQKLWIVCSVAAKICVEGGFIDYNKSFNVITTQEYKALNEATRNSLVEYLHCKRTTLDTNLHNTSESLIKDLREINEQNIRQTNLISDTSDWILYYSTIMVLYHEYSHILNNDPKEAPLTTLINNERRADLDAYRWLVKFENNIISTIAALCLQASTLLTSKVLYGIDHPSTDSRIRYILEEIPIHEDKTLELIVRDLLETLVLFWAKQNGKEQTFAELGSCPEIKTMIDYLETQREIQENL